MLIKKKIKDCSIKELKYLIKKCEYKQIYPDYYYVCKWLIKANNHFYYSWLHKNKNNIISDEVLKIFNQSILNLEVEVLKEYD